MNDFTFVIQADESSALELQLGRFISSAAPQVALLTGPQSANLVLSGPSSGTAALPSYRQLVTADLSGVTLPVANGGTGATSATGARTNLSAAASGANSDITSLSGLTTALSVSQGGTGASTASGTALDNITGFSTNGYVKRTGAGAYSRIATIPIADGGTGATTQAAALSAILASSLIPIANGGTNASTASGARSNLGAAASGANSDITSLSGLSTALSIVQGGTGATTQAAALTALLGASLVPIANGGTNASTASGARTSLGLGTIATQNANAVAVTGGTVDGTPIGGTTAAAGAFTTISASGAITPSQTNGIVGTNTNNNANAGAVGEYVTNTTLNSSVSNNVAMNATSVSLTAGDWDVQCQVQTVPAGSTTTSVLIVGVSTTSATFGTISGSFGNFNQIPALTAAGIQNDLASPVTRVSVASTTTVYCVAQVAFAVSTMQIHGFIRARRVR